MKVLLDEKELRNRIADLAMTVAVEVKLNCEGTPESIVALDEICTFIKAGRNK